MATATIDKAGHTYWAVHDSEADKWICMSLRSAEPTEEDMALWPKGEYHQVDRFSQCVDETYDGKSGWVKCVNLVRQNRIKEAAVLRDSALIEIPDFEDCETEDEVLDKMLRHRARAHLKHKQDIRALKGAGTHEELEAVELGGVSK